MYIDMTSKSEIYFDEVDKVRIVDPNTAKQSNDLNNQCNIFVEEFEKFENISYQFICKCNYLAAVVEKHKVKAISARNILQNLEKDKQIAQQMQVLLGEKLLKLERMKIFLGSLKKVESEQTETINRLCKL